MCNYFIFWNHWPISLDTFKYEHYNMFSRTGQWTSATLCFFFPDVCFWSWKGTGLLLYSALTQLRSFPRTLCFVFVSQTQEVSLSLCLSLTFHWFQKRFIFTLLVFIFLTHDLDFRSRNRHLHSGKQFHPPSSSSSSSSLSVCFPRKCDWKLKILSFAS